MASSDDRAFAWDIILEQDSTRRGRFVVSAKLTTQFIPQFVQGLGSPGTTVILVDAYEHILLSQEVHELQDGLAPNAPNQVILQDIGGDEDLFVVGIPASLERGGSNSISKGVVVSRRFLIRRE